MTAFWRMAGGLVLRGGLFNVGEDKYAYWYDVRGVSSTSPSRDAYTQPGRNVSMSLAFDF